jgi:hypothetical protein
MALTLLFRYIPAIYVMGGRADGFCFLVSIDTRGKGYFGMIFLQALESFALFFPFLGFFSFLGFSQTIHSPFFHCLQVHGQYMRALFK